MAADYGLGSCCACEGTDGVRNVYLLKHKAPVAGTGWGCVVCGLSADGAVAVLCDRCHEAEDEARFACVGYPGRNERVFVGQLEGEHRHDPSKHLDELALLN